MRWDAMAVVICELIAALAWTIHYQRIRERRFRLFALYLCFLAGVELLNLLFPEIGIINALVLHLNVPIELIFLIGFLLLDPVNKQRVIIFLLCALVYLAIYTAERFHLLIPPVNFDSLSYGVGTLMLIGSLIAAIVKVFREKDLRGKDPTALFWIIAGIMLFYIGSFPYENFRNFMWSNKPYWPVAWFLHYLSQGFSCLMYLVFAYAVKWKIN